MESSAAARLVMAPSQDNAEALARVAALALSLLQAHQFEIQTFDIIPELVSLTYTTR